MSFFRNPGDGLSIDEAPTRVDFPDGSSLRAILSGTYVYPVQGWTWFATEAAARVAFGLPVRRAVVGARNVTLVMPKIPPAAALAMGQQMVATSPTFDPEAQG